MGDNDTPALALGYTTTNTTQFSAGQYLISRLAIYPGLSILDVGCGTGNLTLHLATLVGPKGSVTGIDPSPSRLAIAKSLAIPANAAPIKFHQAKAEDLSLFRDGSFDVVFVNSTLHWVQDQARAISEFARVLRRHGGTLGISGQSGDFEAHHERIKREVLSREPYTQFPEIEPPRFLKKQEMEKLLKNAGLAVYEMGVNKIVKKAKDAKDMVEWLDTSSGGKTYGGIPMGEMREKARGEMEVLWEELVQEGGGISMDLELLVTVAVK